MIGSVLALLAGFSFSVSNVFIRKGVHRSGEAFSLIPLFALMGTVFFGLPVLISGEIERLASVSWVALTMLAVAGIIHFILGRLLGFSGMNIIGANRAVPIMTGSILFSALMGIFWLGEPVTIFKVLAIALIICGVLLISSTGNSGVEKPVSRGLLVKGFLLTLLGALCWGISPALIKVGLREVTSPVLATFVSYAAAFVVIGLSLFHPANAQKVRRLSRAALIPLIFGALAVTTAQILRYTALSYGGVSVVEPLSGSMNSLFIFPLSFFMNRKLEAFNLRIMVGAIAIVVGIFLMFWLV